MKIRQLPPHVANQIAAGEVIERPASVVKELLENAVDAGAKSIELDIEHGGVNRIKISDDGCGIVADDLPLAITAHATSKIECLTDLYQLNSLGFRGEALASIASVSQLKITSKPTGQAHAMLLESDEYSKLKLSPCARSQGTTVDVLDLFCNAPVRKKFLKTEKTEFHAIEQVVKCFAMSQPGIAIRLTHNGKTILKLVASTCEKTRVMRMDKIFGKDFSQHAIYLDVNRGGTRLWGWISQPDFHRSQNDKQWVYVNQRMVKDKLINHAIKKSLESFLPPGRFPYCLLYLELPKKDVDVNVHPTKHEVRFQQPRLIHDLIVSQLTSALSEPATESMSYLPDNDSNQPMQLMEPVIRSKLYAEALEENLDKSHWVYLNDEYVVFFYENLPYLVEIKALHKQYLEQKINRATLPLASRALLVPVQYHSGDKTAWVVEQIQEPLLELGIDIGAIGSQTLLIRTVPCNFPSLNIQQLFDLITDGPQKDIESYLKRYLVQSACMQSPAMLSEEEQYSLLGTLSERIRHASHGDMCYKPLDLATCRAMFHG